MFAFLLVEKLLVTLQTFLQVVPASPCIPQTHLIEKPSWAKSVTVCLPTLMQCWLVFTLQTYGRAVFVLAVFPLIFGEAFSQLDLRTHPALQRALVAKLNAIHKVYFGAPLPLRLLRLALSAFTLAVVSDLWRRSQRTAGR